MTAEPSEPATNATKEMAQHIQVAYQDAIDNIIRSKNQQWLVTHYSVLLYAVVVTLARMLTEPTQFEYFALHLIALVTLVASIIGVSKLQSSIKKFRSRLGYIYSTYFSQPERDGLNLKTSEKGFWYDPVICLCLIGTTGLGCAIAIYMVNRLL